MQEADWSRRETTCINTDAGRSSGQGTKQRRRQVRGEASLTGPACSLQAGGDRLLSGDEDVPLLKYCIGPPTPLPLTAQARPPNHTSLNASSREIRAFEVTSSLPTSGGPPQDTCQNATKYSGPWMHKAAWGARERRVTTVPGNTVPPMYRASWPEQGSDFTLFLSKAQ